MSPLAMHRWGSFRYLCQKSLLPRRITPSARPLMLFSAQLSTSPSPATDLSNIRNEFRKFEGGQILLSKDEEKGIASICVDFPDKKNGFSGKMMVELNEIITSLEEWKTGKGILLYSNGDTFCSGGYLDTVKQICYPQGGFKMATLMHDTTIKFRRIPFVSLSVVQGKALGGGAELLLMTDYRLVTPSTEIAFVEAKMGVGSGWGGSYLLKDLVGRQKALDILITCRKMNAAEAIRLGLADAQIDDENRVEVAKNWLHSKIEQHDYTVIQTVKNIVNSKDLEGEKHYFAESWSGPIQIRSLSRNIKHK